MPDTFRLSSPSHAVPVLGWRRLRVALGVSVAMGLPIGVGWESGLLSLLMRTCALGLLAVLAFGLFERWPARLPRRVARWALQVAAVALAMPVGTLAIYLLSTPAGAPPFWQDPSRGMGFVSLSMGGMLVAPWVALAALVRQKDAWAREQALGFELERSELQRQALDARLRLVQAQVQPHFLFNTLANVRELVEGGAPQAASVLDSLIAYLRAAVPRLHDAETTLGQELDMVRAYLELMHMRMPDRLIYTLSTDDAAASLRCPPTTLLTLVENAIRHGIDPSEDGGRVDVAVRVHDGACHVTVADTGVGLAADDSEAGTSGIGGTGLASLRERLRMAFGDAAWLTLAAARPRGALAELRFPALQAAR